MDLKKVFFLLVLAGFTSFISYSQNGIKIKIATNTGAVMSEPGSADIITDPVASFGTVDGTSDFNSDLILGIEAELIVPVGDKLGVGVEVGNTKYSGSNETPIYYNYFASSYSPIYDYGQEALMYNTSITNLVGTFRIYPLGHNTLTPYIKAYGGFAFVATDLQYLNPEDQVNIYDPLYSRGTNLSVSEPSRYSTSLFGGGFGFEYQLAGNISLIADLCFSYINTDIVDGVPNFSYDEDLGYSVYYECATVATKFSAGVCYTFGDSPGKGKSAAKGNSHSKGTTSNQFPFYRRK